MVKLGLEKLFRSTTLVIIYQLIALPLAIAENGVSPKENAWQAGAGIATGIVTAITAGATSMHQNQQPQNQYPMYRQQLAQSLELKPVNPSEVPPVFSGQCQNPQILNQAQCNGAGFAWSPGCIVLPARGNQLSADLKCSSKSPQELKAGYAKAMISVAEFNFEQLTNYTTKGHARFSTQGIGCYDKKLEDFNAKLLVREEELSKYRERLKALLDNFKLQSKADLDGINESTAMLDGGADSDKHLGKDFKFETAFTGIQDPGNVCGSILAPAQFAKKGKNSKGGGLRGIEEMLSGIVDKPSASEKGALEILSKARNMNKEIDNYANKFSSSMKNRKTGDISKIDISFNGKFMSNTNAALKKIKNSFKKDYKNKSYEIEANHGMKNMARDYGKSDLSSIKLEIESGNFEMDDINESLKNYEEKEKRNCLSKVIISNFGSVSSFATKFKNPLISKELVKGSNNALANDIISFMGNTSDNNALLEKIKKSEKNGLNSNSTFAPGKSFRVGDKSFNASAPMRPSAYMSAFIKNCKKEFEVKNGKRTSRAAAMDNIRNYAGDMENLNKISASSISSKIKNEMKLCPSDKETGTALLSCDRALDTNGANFCVRTAVTCASNMKGCYEKAQSIVKSVKAKQDSHVKNYEANVDSFKNSLKQEMVALNNFMELQARSLDGQLNLGGVFKTPPINFNLSEEILNEKDFDPSLKIQDPVAYLEKANEDIRALEASLKVQRLKYAGANGKGGELGKIKSGYVKAYNSGKSDWKNIIKTCEQAMGKAQEFFAKQDEATNKGNEELAKACAELQAFNINPASAEDTLADDLGKVVQVAAATPMGKQYSAIDKFAISQIRAFDHSCGSSSEDGGMLLPGTKDSKKISVRTFCGGPGEKFFEKDGKLACEALNNSDGKEYIPDSEFKTLVGNLKLCENDQKDIVSYTKKPWEEVCAKEDGNLKVKIDSKNAIANASEISKGGFVSYLPNSLKPKQSDEAKEVIAAMVKGYNCKKDRERSGAIGVSVCNASSAGSVNGKGSMWNDLAKEFGSAIGASKAARQ